MSVTDLYEGPDDVDVDDEPLTIGGEAEAERVLERLARTERHAAALRDQHAVMVARYDRWLADELTKTDAAAERHRQLLASWMDARLAADPRAAKTVHLPIGTVAVRKGAEVVEVTDEAAFLAWAETNRPDLIRRPEPRPPAPAPDKLRVRKTLRPALADDETGTGVLVDPDTGDIAPGIHFARRDRSVHITFT